MEGHVQKKKQVVAMAQYQPKAGGGRGVMELIEKLIYDAQRLKAEATRGEKKAEADYQRLIAKTNDSVAALQKEILAKTSAKIQTEKEMKLAKSDKVDTEKEIEGLTQYENTLHQDCDFIMKNFKLRQENRWEEIKS